MFKKLTIGHFKSIERAEISFGMINVLVGNNGSGKSNLIDALRFLKDAVSNGLDRAVSDRHGIVSIRQWSPTRPFRIHLGIEFADDDNSGGYELAIESGKGEFSVWSEQAHSKTKVTFIAPPFDQETEKVTTSFEKTEIERRNTGEIKLTTSSIQIDDESDLTPEEAFAFIESDTASHDFKTSQSDETIFVAIPLYYQTNNLRRQISNFQAYSIYPNTLRLPQEPSNETYLTPEGRNLASLFKRMRKTKAGLEAIAQITESMQLIVPHLDRISILNVGGYLVPQFHIMEPNNKGHIFNVSQMSDGTLRILGLLTALYQQPRPAVIALEEPEQTVNPGILRVLAEAIKEVSRSTQVFVTTHSPNLLDYFDASDVRAVEMVGGKTVVGPIAPQQLAVVREKLFSLGEILITDGFHL